MRGRKPKPTSLKLLEGNPGHRPLPEDEPQPELYRTEAPPAPEHLHRLARERWEDIAPRLARLGLLSEVDTDALEMYCGAYARYRQAQAKLAESNMIVISPSGYPMQSPWVAILNRALRQMRQLAVEFGMTPSSRTRVQTEDPSGAGGEGDPIDAFLSRRPRIVGGDG